MNDENKPLTEENKKASGVVNDLLAYLSVLACIVTLGYQAYLWQHKGKWVELPLYDLLEKTEWFRSWGWIHHPESLYALQNTIVYFLHLELAAFIALIAAAFFAIGMRDKK